MKESNQRKSDRVPVIITSFVRKSLPEGGHELMQFISKDLSEGGVFIVADDLSLFDLSEDVSLIVEQNKSSYFEGSARVVRSARIFNSAGDLTESGFGLMFVEADEKFRQMIADELSAHRRDG